MVPAAPQPGRRPAAPGPGKTSLLNALSAAIPDHERIVVIEDSSELQLHQPHTVYLEAQPARPGRQGAVTIRDLFVDSLRMRPDRIVVGEVRRGEALDLIQSMLSGHDGSLTHGPRQLPAPGRCVRLETLCLMNDVGLPVYVARTQVASAVHVIAQVARLADGSRRVVGIAEVDGLDTGGPLPGAARCSSSARPGTTATAASSGRAGADRPAVAVRPGRADAERPRPGCG